MARIPFYADSDGPDVDLLCHDAPVGVVVVRGDYVEVLHVAVDQVVQLALTEHVVEPGRRTQISTYVADRPVHYTKSYCTVYLIVNN